MMNTFPYKAVTIGIYMVLVKWANRTKPTMQAQQHCNGSRRVPTMYQYSFCTSA